MDIKEFLRLYGFIEEYIESHTYSYWQKYVNGVNMSFIGCGYYSDDNRLPKLNNKFSLMAFKKDVILQNSN